MLQVARLAPNLLHDATELVTQFVHTQLHPSGGFVDRNGQPDLYFTVFGLECLLSLQQPLPDATRTYLLQFDEGEKLDFIHLACLARCHAMLTGQHVPPEVAGVLAQKIEQYRSKDGGYNDHYDADVASAYACFVAVGALLDLNTPVSNPEGLRTALKSLKTSDGGYTNMQGIDIGMVPSTAAALTVLHHLKEGPEKDARDFLLSCMYKDGGFLAMPDAPMPDLLSTAVAIHALSTLKFDMTPIADQNIDFIETLWTNKGSFYAHWAEEAGDLDCEYTFYALLALGHLSLYGK